MMKTVLKISGLYILLAFLSSNAWAQFPGDVFFETPSQTAEVGDEVRFDVLGFSGSDVFGAAAVEIFFDTTKLEFIGTSSNVDATCTDDGVLSFATVNGSSLTAPLGTVDLAEINFKIIGGEGTISRLFVQANDYLVVDGSSLTVGRGLTGDVVIGNIGGGGGISPVPLNSSRSSANTSLTESENDELISRAKTMRRSGYPVTLNYFTETGDVKTTTIFNSDSSVQSE